MRSQRREVGAPHSTIDLSNRESFHVDPPDRPASWRSPTAGLVAAVWCPVCRAQKPILEKLAKDEKFKEFVFFKIDFDTQKAAWRKLSAQRQSTLIVFKGSKEVGRSVGDTNAASIEKLLAKAL
jgi:thiol-disulfide isomerase/thioredoxin